MSVDLILPQDSDHPLFILDPPEVCILVLGEIEINLLDTEEEQ